MESMVSPLMHLKGSVSNPFLITILGSIVTATALTVYHFVIVRYCIGRHVTTTTATSEQPTPVHDPPGAGVDEKVLAAIPIIVFSDLDHHHHQEEEECVVCLGELEGDDLVRLLPNCKHAFHVACIDTWLGAHTTCPLCRSPVPGEIDLEPVGRSRDPAYLQSSNDEGSTSLDSGGDLSSPRASGSLGLLRHCASVVFPPPERTSPRLKRSLSMDQSLVVIDMRRADNCSSNSPSSSRNDRMRGSSCSTSHFDRVSSKLFRSLSWLRVGRGSSSSSILPY